MMFYSLGISMSAPFPFSEKCCNHFMLKSQELFLMTTLLINNEAVEHGKLHKVDGHLLVPLQCFARHLIGF